jgi:hypothetical protein
MFPDYRTGNKNDPDTQYRSPPAVTVPLFFILLLFQIRILLIADPDPATEAEKLKKKI